MSLLRTFLLGGAVWVGVATVAATALARVIAWADEEADTRRRFDACGARAFDTAAMQTAWCVDPHCVDCAAIRQEAVDAAERREASSEDETAH